MHLNFPPISIPVKASVRGPLACKRITLVEDRLSNYP